MREEVGRAVAAHLRRVDHGLGAGSGDAGGGDDSHTRLGTWLAPRPLARPRPGGCGSAACAGAVARPGDAGPGAPARPPLNPTLPRCVPLPGAGRWRPAHCPTMRGAAVQAGGRVSAEAVREYVSALSCVCTQAPPLVETAPEAEGRVLRGRGGAKGKWFLEFVVPKKGLLIDPNKSEIGM